MLRLTTILRVRVNSITTNCNDVECLGSTLFPFRERFSYHVLDARGQSPFNLAGICFLTQQTTRP